MAKKILLTTFLFLFALNKAFCLETEWQTQESGGAATRIIGSFYHNETKEKKLILGAHFKISDGWKIYGNDSGGIGLPPSFDFSSSKNIINNQISWPDAKVEEELIGDERFKFLIYQNEVIIPIEVSLNEIKDQNSISLKIDYGLCKDICVPASSIFNFEIHDEIDEASLNAIQKFYPQKIANPVVVTQEPAPTEEFSSSKALFTMILISLIGGAILNIMPCVLPVLSIKLISIINHSNASLARIRFAFVSTIIGILACFMFFAASAAVIKATGNSLGWGLQFQNPYFLIFLIIILAFFTANLLGIFEITFQQFLTNFLNKKIIEGEGKKNIFMPNFLSGVLAVLLATPCSAPFLGTAISFALSQNLEIIFLVFFMIGLGFALPYIILLITPKIVYLLPKPGNWMTLIKKLMAVFLGITILWLGYVLSHNIGCAPAILAVLSAALLLVALKAKSQLLKFISLVLLLSFSFSMPKFFVKEQCLSEMEEIWKEFDESKIQAEIDAGHVVVIDVTADWCLTCKFNKTRVLTDKEVVAKLKSDMIVAMRADITKPNPKILEFLHKHHRFAIPFNAVYGPNARQGLLTNELLTKKELFELIEKAK